MKYLINFAIIYKILHFLNFCLIKDVMSAIILNGTEISTQYRSEISNKAKLLKEKFKIAPKLVVILIGHGDASEIYVKNKKIACEKVGIDCEIMHYDQSITEQELLVHITKLNLDSLIHGILIQLPLPKHINVNKIIECIDPMKDVDGFHPLNIGALALGIPKLRACTPFGIIQLLDAYKIELQSKDVLMIGLSRIVGLPMSLELINRDATVTCAQSFTQNLPNKIKEAEIIIVATGHRNVVHTQDLNSNQIIIDVGIHYLDNKICGDVDFDKAKHIVKAITPVPGGVGPMTVTALLQNILVAYESQAK
jgi:methylenetetrahydrofolate dehydrogenase (NADP+)/methenyltetrahydrofolate cyclohydrolase